MEGPKTFGSWLKTARRALGLTQDKFARLVYCAPVTVRKMEQGRLRPSYQLTESILEKVGVPPEEREPLIRMARARAEPAPGCVDISVTGRSRICDSFERPYNRITIDLGK